jgi:glycosyltransferase involved in cell wall biosynthesis
MCIALVHDWLTGMRGGEKCLNALCRVWPGATVFTLIHRRGSVSPAIERMTIRTSFLQHIPGIVKSYRYFLPLMPAAIERFRLDGFDLVISLSHCVAKSVRVPAGVPHICYCFTPMRYAWHQRGSYFGAPRGVTGRLRELLLAKLRRWDRETSGRVTRFVAISRTVNQRIRECFGRTSHVIYPPVDTDYFTPSGAPREDFYLCVSALVPYKRLDLAVAACSRLGRHLVVIGTGPDERRLRAAAGSTVRFLGWQSDEIIRDYYRRCRALLFPGEEDFGIVPLEAQACGAPVIAYAAGGATETVVPAGPNGAGTGILFHTQSVDQLADCILNFESGRNKLNATLARSNAEQFRTSRFTAQMQRFAESVARGNHFSTSMAGDVRDAA